MPRLALAFRTIALPWWIRGCSSRVFAPPDDYRGHMGPMQLEAMSTYLNGFHMYADEMGRQVETDDGQADQELIRQRDSRLGVSTAHKRGSRADIPTPEVAPGDNPWEDGRTFQTRLEEMEFKG